MSHAAARAIDLFGIPSDAGASCRGSGMGPDAMRVAGLVETLVTLGYMAMDHGDMPGIDARPVARRGGCRMSARQRCWPSRGRAVSVPGLAAGGSPARLCGRRSLAVDGDHFGRRATLRGHWQAALRAVGRCAWRFQYAGDLGNRQYSWHAAGPAVWGTGLRA